MNKRSGYILAFTALSVLAAFLLPAIPQPVGYHDFADHRAMFGVSNFLDVASNIGFLLVAIAGLVVVFRQRTRFALDRVPQAREALEGAARATPARAVTKHETDPPAVPMHPHAGEARRDMTTWSAATGILLSTVLSAAAAAPPPAPTAIEGPVWRLTGMRGQDEKGLAALRNGVTVRFDGGRLHGFGGCNQLMGSYTTEGDRVTLTGLAGTMMACPPPQMAIETAFKRAFTGTLRFSVADNRLTLSAESDPDPTLVFEAAPPPRLEGVTWKVTGFNNGRQAVVSPLIGTTLTLSFHDASIVGHAGCNRFRATYSRDGNRLAVGPVAATRKFCAKKGVMEQEREFLAALESATTWAIDRDMLDLHRADGERVLLAGKSAK